MSINSVPKTLYRTIHVPMKDTSECQAQAAAIEAINNTITGLIRITATIDDNKIIVDVQSEGYSPISAVIPQIRKLLGTDIFMTFETTAHEPEMQEEDIIDKVEEPAAVSA